jgi:hypothetical protein
LRKGQASAHVDGKLGIYRREELFEMIRASGGSMGGKPRPVGNATV